MTNEGLNTHFLPRKNSRKRTRLLRAVEDLLMNSVARTVAMASRCLLTSGEAGGGRAQSAGTRLLSLFGFELRWRG